MKISCEIIGKVDSGDVSKISMENNNGVVISTLTTGATLQEFLVPTETGALKNIVLGFSDYEDYYKNNLCACQSIGRVAGRIGKASYTHNMVLLNPELLTDQLRYCQTVCVLLAIDGGY